MKIFRKNVDERQEIETMSIGNTACLIGIWGLVIAIFLQLYVFHLDIIHVVGEFTNVIAMAAYITVGNFRHGIWDTLSKPGIKSYLAYSFFGVLLYNIPTLANCIKYQTSILDSFTYFAKNFVIAFPIAFALVAGLGLIIKRRQNKLEKEPMDNND